MRSLQDFRHKNGESRYFDPVDSDFVVAAAASSWQPGSVDVGLSIEPLEQLRPVDWVGQMSDLVGPGHLAAVSVVVVAAADQAGVVVARVAETGEVTVAAGLESLGLAEGPVIAEAVSKGVAMVEVFHFVEVRHVETAACRFGFHAY